MLLSSGWPALLWMATVLLGLLAPVTMAEDINTSDTFKVLTSSDNMGGDCDSKRTQVDAMVPEIQQLIKAATDSIDTLLTDPAGLSSWSPSKRNERMRLLLLARRFFGTKFNSVTLKVDSSTKGTLTTVKGKCLENALINNWNHRTDDHNLIQGGSIKSPPKSMPRIRNGDLAVMTPGFSTLKSCSQNMPNFQWAPRSKTSVCIDTLPSSSFLFFNCLYSWTW